MEHCEHCRKTADHLSPCDKVGCPVPFRDGMTKADDNRFNEQWGPAAPPPYELDAQMKKKSTPKMVRRKFIGYCWKCSHDVVTDYCERCQHYVQPSPHDTKRIKAQGDRHK